MDSLLKSLNDYEVESLPMLAKFLAYSATLKNEILLTYPSDWNLATTPPFLPPAVVEFLAKACNMKQKTVVACWKRLKDVVWSIDSDFFGPNEALRDFGELGAAHGWPSPFTLWPPNLGCTNPRCTRADKGRKLQTARQQRVILYTVAHGPVAAYTVRLECEDCKTTYHHDYSENAGRRSYYDTCASALEVTAHKYIETKLITHWKLQMNTAWVSSSNNASIYLNLWPEADDNLPTDWNFKASTLDGEEVFDSIILLSLIDDCTSRNTILDLPHRGDQSKRMVEAVRARNERIRLVGLPDVDHCCEKCVRHEDVVDPFSVVVMDGITLGRPTCEYARCQLPLRSTKDRFCPTHMGLNNVCSATDCQRPVRPDHRTCDIEAHILAEDTHVGRGKATFQYKHKLERARVAHPKNGEPVEISTAELIEEEDALEETYEIIGDRAVPATADVPTQAQAAMASIQPEQGTSVPPAPIPTTAAPPKIRLVFGRSRTHNEFIIVGPCGCIIARDTMYYAEAIPAVAEMIKRVFRNRRKPKYIVFDNNCSLARHVRNPRTPGHEYFDDINLPVDVFHFNCKHSKADEYCKAHCDPSNFPELLAEDGKGWFFNTSIAEQTNVWLGGFHSICREMNADRYDFFLDEMIIMRNRITLRRLRKRGVMIVELD